MHYPEASPATAPFDIEKIRADFPALNQTVYDHPLVYLDNAATAQKPRAVIDRMVDYYARENSNVHRGVHYLSQRATDAYEGAREGIRAFINARSTREVILTAGTTGSINLVASSYGLATLKPGEEIIVSRMEHHSNIVPWQLLCERTGARLRVIPVDDRGALIYEDYQRLLTDRTRLVAVAHVSNALGTINPVEQMIEDAHGLDIPVLLDGAQAMPHMAVDVQALDCDFYCFSSHKMFGPTGVGVLYGKEALLERMPPYQGGGDMIESVSFERTTYNELPHKFEAGTPNIAGTIGLGAAVDYLNGIGYEAIERHEHDVFSYATERLAEIDGLRLFGTADHKASVASFLVGDIHPYDAGTILDRLGIAVRTGHHCTQPLMRRFGIPGTVRASFAFYNSRADVDALVEGLRKVQQMLG
jgi:cysteine desulfurase/selenocysteine lyase